MAGVVKCNGENAAASALSRILLCEIYLERLSYCTELHRSFTELHEDNKDCK
jgi:hypothetical protein